MKKLRIGLVDLDTSHPGSWLPVIRELGHEVIGVFDGGTVYPAGYAQEFATKHEIATVFHSLAEMADAVDLAIIHSCNWDLHVERAKAFVTAGKGVFIDKPMVGNLRDMNQVLAWQQQGAQISGGSSLRYVKSIQAFRASLEPGEEIRFVYSGTGVDEFNYGIHAYSTAQGILGSGICWVRHLDGRTQHQVEIAWESGARAILTIGGTTNWLPFWAIVITDRRVVHLAIDSNQLYRDMLEVALPYYAGAAPAPAPLTELLECEKAALAAKASWQGNGAIICLNDLGFNNPSYDGAAFGESYRLEKLTPTS